MGSKAVRGRWGEAGPDPKPWVGKEGSGSGPEAAGGRRVAAGSKLKAE